MLLLLLLLLLAGGLPGAAAVRPTARQARHLPRAALSPSLARRRRAPRAPRQRQRAQRGAEAGAQLSEDRPRAGGGAGLLQARQQVGRQRAEDVGGAAERLLLVGPRLLAVLLLVRLLLLLWLGRVRFKGRGRLAVGRHVDCPPCRRHAVSSGPWQPQL
jgi:hypothetical protein